MRMLTKQAVIEWVRFQGESAKLDDVLSGFDFSRPVYERDFWPGDALYQLTRLPALPRIPSNLDEDLPPSIGNGFGLPRITTRGVSINDGLSGHQAPLKFESIGNWFGLLGITTRGVAINDGLSGRRALKFEAIAHFRALEGTAAPLPKNVGTGVGGRGGQTQVFLPWILLNRLECKGQIDRW